AGLDELHIYCYSAWGFDSSSSTYSPGFVLACGAVPAADPVSFNLTPGLNYINLSWVRGGEYRTLVRRQQGTAPQDIDEGVLIYNGTDSSYQDLASDDTPLTEGVDYCYSIWHVNSVTGAISNNHLEQCTQLVEVGNVTNLTSSSLLTNSVSLSWTKAQYSTNTHIRRLQGMTPPANRTEGIEVYNSTGASYTDNTLNQNTDYCYSAWSYDEVLSKYSKSKVSVCVKTLEVINGQCGSANKSYSYASSSYGGDSFCSVGISSPITPAFPALGATVSWACSGSNGGTTASCSAKHLAGTIVYTENINGLYIVGSFTLIGSGIVSTSWTPPIGVTSVEYLVVAGGGGGGGTSTIGGGGGGGGAGGFRTGTLSVNSETSYSVIVGAGGAISAVGGKSVFGNIESAGGAPGRDNAGSYGTGYDGGSGGGCKANHPSYGQFFGGLGNIPSTTVMDGVPQGYNGGPSVTSRGSYCASGGGGAGGNSPGLDGGLGRVSSITGTSLYYGGGGGAGGQCGPGSGYTERGIGGSGIGGSGAYTTPSFVNATSGAVNTGSGGGGGYRSSANVVGTGSGSSGIVIIRYLKP
ncbi:MAG: hypothetical protein PHW52_05380, partial [Candidatus Pacebacteria bacterium]|nr:hypothetical protein [Candidatus Paceibacterota bacterium]